MVLVIWKNSLEMKSFGVTVPQLTKKCEIPIKYPTYMIKQDNFFFKRVIENKPFCYSAF